MKNINAIYAQSGGVTSVINSTAFGVIEAANKHSNKIEIKLLFAHFKRNFTLFFGLDNNL
jgi:hypothetical protein